MCLNFVRGQMRTQNRRGNMDLQIGDIVTLKKQHPCGSSDWELLRVGMDFRLKCCGCGHMVMLPRKQVERSIRKVAKAADAE